jgi:smad nuclear-interacting protein 1
MYMQWAIRPYLIDLDTVNGTFLNGERVEGSRYYELLPKVRGLVVGV